MRVLKAIKILVAIGVLVGLVPAHGQQDYASRLGVQRGGAVSFEPTGPGVLFGALDPAIKKWYVPQELYTDYGWRQWEYSNYARTPYERYVNTTREGDYFYGYDSDYGIGGYAHMIGIARYVAVAPRDVSVRDLRGQDFE